MLSKLFQNKAIRNVFMNQFKDIIKEHNLKAIVIHIKEDGEYSPELFKEEIKVLPLSEYNNLINAIKSQL